eukprot:TRINITY_DN366_c0_g1_i1.p1 TRINITY_DN366_c0_g1~~TRINITY_DN366_c0_g1_i1.p1  ORF type:complete len:478 (+),score=45.39 TRINITY_DN366_c0_g1_i1:70-1503(+)
MTVHSETDNVSVSSTNDSNGFKGSKGEASLRKNPSWHFTVVSAAFTTAQVFAPGTLSMGGWVWGSVWWTYSTLSTWWSAILIGKCVLHGSKRGVGSTYAEMMEDAFGSPGYVFTIAMQLITYYLSGISLLVNAGNWCLLAQEVLQKVHRVEGGLCLWQWIVVCGVVTNILAHFTTFRHMLPLAIFSLLATVARQGIMYYQMALYDVFNSCEPTYGSVNFNSVITSLSTTAFLYGGHGLFPEAIREMRKPESYFRAVHVCYMITALIYVSSAFPAYYAWGSWTAGDVQFNWPLNTPTLVSALLSIAWVIIGIGLANLMMLRVLEDLLKLELPASSSSLVSVAFFWLRRSLGRSLFVWSEVFFAWMLASAGLADLQGLAGALGFTALTYYAPFAAYWKLIARHQKEPVWRQLTYGFAFLSGVLVMVVGVYTAVSDMVQARSTYHLFDTSTCHTSSILNLNSCSNPCREAYALFNSTCDA